MSSATRLHSSPVDRNPDTPTTTSVAEGDGRAANFEDLLNPTIINRQWNGDPMDWESWPTGRPGPSVPEGRLQEAMDAFQNVNAARDEQSRTKKNVLHVAEFSSSGRGEFDLSCSSPE